MSAQPHSPLYCALCSRVIDDADVEVGDYADHMGDPAHMACQADFEANWETWAEEQLAARQAELAEEVPEWST